MNLQALPRAPYGTSIVWGILLMLFGLSALVAPAATSMGATIVLAWVLMFVGFTHFFSTWHAHTLGAIAGQMLVGALYFIVGLAIQRHPLWGVTSLTMIIGAVFMAEGVLGLVAHFSEEERPTSRLLSAVVSLFLGSMIWNQWPSSSLWVIGTLVGINLLFAGATHLTLALGARRLERLGI